MNPIKIVLVGERQTGKTTLCCTYANKTWVNVDYQLKTWPESALDDGNQMYIAMFPHFLYVFVSCLTENDTLTFTTSMQLNG